MPLARHDCARLVILLVRQEFLLTCLLRGMTTQNYYLTIANIVSTHMPLARHDVRWKE